jgi:hypothetical protein
MEINVGPANIIITIYFYCVTISSFLINMASLLFCRYYTLSSANPLEMVQESGQENFRYSMQWCLVLTTSQLVRRMFVQAFGFDGKSKFAESKFVGVVKWWTMEKQMCRKMDYKIPKWQIGHPCLRELCSAQGFRSRCGLKMTDGTDFGKPAILTFVHSHGDVYQKHRHICPLTNVSHNSIFTLCVGLVPSQLNTKLLIENWDIIKVVYSWVAVQCCRTGEEKIDVS